MKDPYIHAEKTSLPGFGHLVIQALITDAVGVAPDLPKTVGTGCGLRRPFTSTSTVPEEITCLPCREWLHQECLTWAAMADVAAQLAQAEPRAAISAKATPADLRDEERTYRALAARFGVAR